LRKSAPDVRASWSREENLHLTLKFLGDVPVSGIDALSIAAQRAAQTAAPCELIIGGCGAFPSSGQPRVLWIGIQDPAGQLEKLHQSIEDECAAAGFAREAKPFHPHLTVARLRRPHGARELAALHKEIGFAPLSFKASEFCVFRSELRSSGSRHTVISRHEFSSS
jgi:2'-5' RNA ligase